MDQSQAPLLDAVAGYHQRDEIGFTPPGHKQVRGIEPRVLAALGEGVFRSDLLATAGLDDRTSSQGLLTQAEELMADAVGAGLLAGQDGQPSRVVGVLRPLGDAAVEFAVPEEGGA